jgi:NmrA-like family
MSHDSLVSAFKGNEALILMLAFQATPQDHMQLIDAAADAGIKWIIPTEFGSDNGNKPFANMVPINAMKSGPREHVEKLAETHPGLNWIGVVPSAWFDYVCLPSTYIHSHASADE